MDNGTLGILVILLALGFVVWAGRQRAPGPGDGSSALEARMVAMETALKELRRSQVRSNALAEEAKRIAEGVAPTLEQIRWMLERVTTDVTIIKAAQAGTEAAERAMSAQQRRTTEAGTTQFIGTNTLGGPVAGGNIGSITPPPRPTERAHRI